MYEDIDFCPFCGSRLIEVEYSDGIIKSCFGPEGKTSRFHINVMKAYDKDDEDELL